jgi:hypothetical protein
MARRKELEQQISKPLWKLLLGLFAFLTPVNSVARLYPKMWNCKTYR